VAFSDADLLARVLQSEDPNAFGELVRRYQSPVRAFLLRMTRGDAHQADDLAQETFVRAWRKLDQFRGTGRFSTWLFGIAINELRSRARRDRRLRFEAPEDLAADMDLAAERPNPGVRLDVNDALQRLTPAERAALVLCCQNGLTHEEAAQALNCPLGTVKTNVLRGKEKMRKWLQL
jgi:RNA polymerase sigma factor (sigma-70 family)